MNFNKKYIALLFPFLLFGRQVDACYVFPFIDYWTCDFTPSPGQEAYQYSTSPVTVAYVIPGPDLVMADWNGWVNGGNDGYVGNVCGGTSTISPNSSVILVRGNDTWQAMLDEFPTITSQITSGNITGYGNFNLNAGPAAYTGPNPQPFLEILCSPEYGSCEANHHQLALKMNDDNGPLTTDNLAAIYGESGSNSDVNNYIAHLVTNANHPGFSNWSYAASQQSFNNSYLPGCHSTADLSVPGLLSPIETNDTGIVLGLHGLQAQITAVLFIVSLIL